MEWDNINWERGTIRIEKTISEISGKAVITTPKTADSRRTISLPEIVLNHLKEIKKESGFIFLSEAGTPVAPRNLLRHFYKAIEKAGVPRIPFHSLRHTAATILLQQDVHPKKVQDLLGHSSITFLP